MSTNYPGALDSFVNPTATDTLDSATVPHAAQHDNINDAMSAVQVTLGVNPQGGSATVVARLTALDSTVAGKAATNQTMYVGTTAIAINRSSASQTLTGTSIDGNAATATSATSATTAGNLSGTQTAKFVYAAPNGADGTASFRALLATDIPTLNQDTTGNAGTVTNGVYKNAANTFTTGTQIIATGADGTVGFRIKRNSATQTANLLEVTQSDGTTILAKIDSAGAITTASGVTASGTITTSGDITVTGSSGSIRTTGVASYISANAYIQTPQFVAGASASATPGSITIYGATSGNATLNVPSTAGGTHTFPATGGTILNSASAIDVAKITTGTTLPTNVTTANGLTSASSLATVGTITSGTWNADAIAVGKGGTGVTTGLTVLDGANITAATVTSAKLASVTGTGTAVVTDINPTISSLNASGTIYRQVAGAPAGVTTTITAAQLLTMWVTSSPSTAQNTSLPTATTLSNAWLGGDTAVVEWTYINGGAGTVTITSGTSHNAPNGTTTGSPTIAPNTSARFGTRRSSGGSAYTCYRLA